MTTHKLLRALSVIAQIGVVLGVFYVAAIDDKHKEEMIEIIGSMRVSPCYTLSCKGCAQETVVCNDNRDTIIISK